MRPIDADALKSKMDGYWGRCQRIRKPRNGETAVFLDIKAIVEAQPTVDAIPVEWIKEWIEEIEEHPAYTERERYLVMDELKDMLGAWQRGKKNEKRIMSDMQI